MKEKNERIEKMLEGTYRILRNNRRNTGHVLHIGAGMTDWFFCLHLDNKWRLNGTSTYGNPSREFGEGCDASGYVITDETLISKLAELVRS